MKKIIYSAAMILFISIGGLFSQETLVLDIEMASDVPPTVVYMSTDINPVAKVAAESVKSRTRSEIDFVYQNVVYIVEYVNKEYLVGAFHYSSNTDGSGKDHSGLSVDDNASFTSTKVSEVRKWLKSEITSFYENESSTW